MATLRDTQRNRIIRAEDSYNLTFLPQRGVLDFWRLEDLANHITARSWWQKQGGPAITVREGRHGSDCMPIVRTYPAVDYTIELAKNRQTRLHLLHGMTHALIDYGISHKPRQHLKSNTPHDPEFVKTYLEMVRRFQTAGINEQVKKDFKACLRAEKVKTKEVSEATREKQREAMLRRMTPTMEQMLQNLQDLEEM